MIPKVHPSRITLVTATAIGRAQVKIVEFISRPESGVDTWASRHTGAGALRQVMAAVGTADETVVGT